MKKYDCTRTLDFGHERNRLCKSYEECEGCLLSGGHCVDFIFTEEQIRNLQKWSDEHPEIPKLTREEYAFLRAFQVTADKHLERKIGHLWLVMGYINMELWSSMFPFIKEGETWKLDDLLKLEVEE